MRIHKLLCLLLCLCLLMPMIVSSHAASSDEIKSEIQMLKQLEQDLREKTAELEQLRTDNLTELSQIVEQKQLLDQQVALLNQQIVNVQEQIRVMKEAIVQQQTACDEATANYDALKEKHLHRIRAMEEQGNLTYWAVLFSANSFADFLDRMNMIQEIAAADRLRIEALRQAAQKMDAEQEALLLQQGQLQETADKLAQDEELLAQKRQEATELLYQLMEKAEEYDELLEEQEKEQYLLAVELANKQSEFDQALYQEWLANQPPVNDDKDTDQEDTQPEEDKKEEPEKQPEEDKKEEPEKQPEEDKKEEPEKQPEEEEKEEEPAPMPQIGGWVMPVPPNHVLSSPFGMRENPITGQMVMHSGIDLACPEGTPIYAGNGGQVLRAEYSASMGNYVLIDHGSGYRTVYMHMTHSIVSPGQYVQAGQNIGFVGNTGASRGNHLHYGVSYNGTYINPYNFVYGG